MRIIMITDYRGYFRQHVKESISLNKNKIKKILEELGFEVIEYRYEDLINSEITLEGETIIYTSSQNGNYKKYIDDILYYISKKNVLIPRYDIFKAHENKGFQEILKKEMGIKSLKASYFGNKEGLSRNESDYNYPLIVKAVSGAGSKNVFRANNIGEVISIVRRINKPVNYGKYILKKLFKKFAITSKIHGNFLQDDVFSGQYVLQEYISGLKDDWKVLVFGNKFYVLNRKVRKKDFRASGSGIFLNTEVPLIILEYAKYVFQMLDIPFVSLDIAYDGKECKLIEYQGLHFGPVTLVKSEFYYIYEDNAWKKNEGRSDLEEEYALSYVNYIHNKELLDN